MFIQYIAMILSSMFWAIESWIVIMTSWNQTKMRSCNETWNKQDTCMAKNMYIADLNGFKIIPQYTFLPRIFRRDMTWSLTDFAVPELHATGSKSPIFLFPIMLCNVQAEKKKKYFLFTSPRSFLHIWKRKLPTAAAVTFFLPRWSRSKSATTLLLVLND